MKISWDKIEKDQSKYKDTEYGKFRKTCDDLGIMYLNPLGLESVPPSLFKTTTGTSKKETP